MANTISDLWNGNIAPVEHCGSHDLKANMLIGMVEQQKEALIDSLTDTQLRYYIKIPFITEVLPSPLQPICRVSESFGKGLQAY